MAKNIDNKPLTIKDIREVLIPAMEKVFATKEDLENFITRDEFHEFKDAILTGMDHILKDLETLMMEKKAEYWQHQRRQKFYKIITQAMSKHKILTINQANKIKQLNIF
ncbi:MAG: hypothetical protein Q8N68_02975 [bacterium]|nr:hypothetical protein [bacterium]